MGAAVGNGVVAVSRVMGAVGSDTSDRFCCTYPHGNSSRGSSMMAGPHEQTHIPAFHDRELGACNDALKRPGSLTVRFDFEMIWDVAPTGKRSRRQSYGDAAIQTCLSIKGLFGMARRQATGFVVNRLRLVGLDWTVPGISAPCRNQRTLAVHIPYRGSNTARMTISSFLRQHGVRVSKNGKGSAMTLPPSRPASRPSGQR